MLVDLDYELGRLLGEGELATTDPGVMVAAPITIPRDTTPVECLGLDLLGEGQAAAAAAAEAGALLVDAVCSPAQLQKEVFGLAGSLIVPAAGSLLSPLGLNELYGYEVPDILGVGGAWSPAAAAAAAQRSVVPDLSDFDFHLAAMTGAPEFQARTAAPTMVGDDASEVEFDSDRADSPPDPESESEPAPAPPARVAATTATKRSLKRPTRKISSNVDGHSGRTPRLTRSPTRADILRAADSVEVLQSDKHQWKTFFNQARKLLTEAEQMDVKKKRRRALGVIYARDSRNKQKHARDVNTGQFDVLSRKNRVLTQNVTQLRADNAALRRELAALRNQIGR